MKRHLVAYVFSLMDTNIFLKNKTTIVRTANYDLLANQSIDYTKEVALTVYRYNCESLRAS